MSKSMYEMDDELMGGMNEVPEHTVRATRNFTIVPNDLLAMDINLAALKVYICLRSYVREGHATFPKAETVCERYNIPIRTFRNSVKELEAAGLLVINKRTYASGMRHVNEYVFPDIPLHPQSASLAPGEVRSVAPREVLPFALPIEEEKPEVEKPKRGRANALALTPLPADFSVSQDELLRLAEKYPTLDVKWQLEQFKDKALAKGWTYKNWVAGFRTWLRTADTYASSSYTRNTVIDAGQRERDRIEGERVAREFYESEGISYK